MAHLYVDESKARGYLLVASVHLPADVTATRKLIGDLVLPRQRRLHMTKESNARRRMILDAIDAAGVQATIFDAGRRHRHELDARAACLETLIQTSPTDTHLVVIERDDSLLDWDRRRLFELVRATGRTELRYVHRRAVEDHLLAIPDAIAWCWAKGGIWRQRVRPVVTKVYDV